jgi:hypothetical protein
MGGTRRGRKEIPTRREPLQDSAFLGYQTTCAVSGHGRHMRPCRPDRSRLAHLSAAARACCERRTCLGMGATSPGAEANPTTGELVSLRAKRLSSPAGLGDLGGAFTYTARARRRWSARVFDALATKQGLESLAQVLGRPQHRSHGGQARGERVDARRAAGAPAQGTATESSAACGAACSHGSTSQRGAATALAMLAECRTRSWRGI